MANVGVAYGILQGQGINTSGMSPKEAWDKVNELKQKGVTKKVSSDLENTKNTEDLKKIEISRQKDIKPKYDKSVSKFYNPQENINQVKKYASSISDETSKHQIEEYIKDLEAEPKITEDMEYVANKVGSELLGYEFRVKGAGSFLRKMEGEEGKPIKDNVRYTFKIGDDIYDTYSKIVDNLKSMGYKEIIVKNYWNDKNNPYNGVNTNFISPTGRILEVQYHDEDGLKIKEEIHKIYEKQRLLKEDDPQYKKYNDEMFSITNKMHRPTNVDKIINRRYEV